MRRLIVSEFLTLDGIMEAPEKWSLTYWNDDIAAFKLAELKASDALLLGRVTYEGFAATWPNMGRREGEYADMMNGYAKLVVSQTLREAAWNNSHIISGNVSEEVSALKQRPGRDILVFGSARLVRGLADEDLVDEYRLLVYPVALGSGKRLFGEAAERRRLELTETRRLGPDVVGLTYRPAR